MVKMREIVLCIVVAFSLTIYTAMAAPPNYGSPFGETSHLVGLDGLCLDIAPFDYISTVLSPCKLKKQSQLWTIVEDGTIISMYNGYCLVPQRDFIGAFGTNVILGDCSKGRSDKKWIKKKDGTILHDESGLVLTGKSVGRYVALEMNKDAPSQSWEATEVFSPMVAIIKWKYNFCLLSREDVDFHLFLNECSEKDTNQRWALYGDGTIRKNDNRNYCLSSSDRDPGSLVVVSKCEDKPQQRWELTEDNTINHPSTNLVIDVKREIIGIFPPFIVVDKHDGTSSQQWTIIFIEK